MLKAWTILLFASLVSFEALSTHIVGGNFKLIHISGPQYEIQLELFNDVQFGNPGAIDLSVKVGVFSKTTNFLKYEVVIPQFSISGIQLSNPSCSGTTNLIISKILYKGYVEMWGNDYKEPGGYYMVFERCCRNNNITNILSPGMMGSVFYLEFPSLQQNPGYSSPNLRNPTTDYACVGRDYLLDFSANPVSGDSIAYRFITPLRGYTSSGQAALPNPIPGPYPPVFWAGNFGLNNIIPGNPPLTVNPTTGILTMRASSTGIYVFSLAVDEFKQGIKIGQVNREYQINVVSNCPINYGPKIRVERLSPVGSYTEGDTLTIIGDSTLCINVLVNDSSTTDRLTVRIVNKTPGTGGLVLQNNVVVTTQSYQTAFFQACVTICDDLTQKLREAYIITTDNSCPRQLVDTLLLKYKYISPQNEKPKVELSTAEFAVETNVLQPLNVEIYGFDTTDQDFISISAIPLGFSFGQVGLKFTPGSGIGKATAYLDWTPTCEEMDKDFIVRFTVKDNVCFQTSFDTISLRVRVKNPDQEVEKFLPPNAFTPNGDGLNDFFALPKLPIDNCGGLFLKYRIFNRWGREVYSCEERDVYWSGENHPGGLYYYLIEFENISFKGTVHLFR